MCADQVVLELHCQSLALGDDLWWYIFSAGKVGEQEQHRQRIVQISKRIYEGRISLFDDVVEFHAWGEVALKARSIADLITPERFADLFGKCLLVSELVE